jgi:hypothetical protein
MAAREDFKNSLYFEILRPDQRESFHACSQGFGHHQFRGDVAKNHGPEHGGRHPSSVEDSAE